MATPQERFRTKVQQMGRTNGGNLSMVTFAGIPMIQASFDDAIDEELYRNGLVLDLLTDICIDTAANQPSSGLVSGGDNSGVWWVVCVEPRTGDSPAIIESATTPGISYSGIWGPYGSYAEAAAKAAEVTPCPGESGSSGSTSGVILEAIPLGVGPSGGSSGTPADASVYVLRKTFRRVKFMGVVDLGTLCKRVTVCTGSCPKPTVKVCNVSTVSGSGLAVLDLPESLTFYIDTWGTDSSSIYCDVNFPDTYTLTYIGLQGPPFAERHVWTYSTRDVYPTGSVVVSFRLEIHAVNQSACFLSFSGGIQILGPVFDTYCYFASPTDFDTTVVIPYPFQVIFYRGGLVAGTITE